MERRRYFRLDDDMELHCERLSAEQADDASKALAPTDAQAMLASFDRQIQTIIESARVQAPAVASLAEMLNRKMNFIIATLDIDHELMERATFQSNHVSLSACGISFGSDVTYETDEKLRLEMRLQPNDVTLVVLARVVDCERLTEPTPEHQYSLRLTFDGISPADQELLIQYIVRRQSMLLQEDRVRRENPDLGAAS